MSGSDASGCCATTGVQPGLAPPAGAVGEAAERFSSSVTAASASRAARRLRSALAVLGLIALTAAAGCSRGGADAAKGAEPDVPVAPVATPVEREVTDFVEFTGRTVAVQAVDVRARVTGYVVGMPFQEGADVKKGDLLFEIDPRPYQALVDQAGAQVELDQAQLNIATANYERAKKLIDKNTISQQELDEAKAVMDEAAARLKADQASAAAYRLNLDFARVESPIDGQVSRYYLTMGNLVNQDQTLLTTVVSLDPLYVYFEMDEPTLLRIRRAVSEGKIKSLSHGDYPLFMGFHGEEGFPHEGTVNFVNNQVEPTTGSVSVRGIFPNHKPEHGARLLSPGMYARVRLPIGGPHKALLVIDRAIGSDQGLKYVYVVDSEQKVQYRRITTGALQDDGLRVITDGIKVGEKIVVGRLPQLRPKMKIKVEEGPMPTLNSSAVSDAAGPGQGGPPAGRAATGEATGRPGPTGEATSQATSEATSEATTSSAATGEPAAPSATPESTPATGK